MHYFDSASTTKPKKTVIQAMMPYLSEKWYNPSSLDLRSKEIQDDMGHVRQQVADAINAKPEEIYFTSSGSESNNWALKGYVDKNVPDLILTTKMEHKSILQTFHSIHEKKGFPIVYLPVNKHGRIDLFAMEDLLKIVDHQLVSVMLANNEIGTIQDMKKIGELVHKYNSVLHTDAVQAFPYLNIDVEQMHIDMLTLSGHKLGTPKGIAVLYVREGIELEPLIHGGTQERGKRGGTENVPYIMALGEAVQERNQTRRKSVSKLLRLKSLFLSLMQETEGLRINSPSNFCLPSIVNISFAQVDGQQLLSLLEEQNIIVATGSACNANSFSVSYVLKEIKVPLDYLNGSIRISFSPENTETEVEELAKQLKSSVNYLRSVQP